MDIVVGASESTMKSLLGKISGLLAQEYTLIRGVQGDLHYINDELASMHSFLGDLSDAGDGLGQGQNHRLKDWMRQIRDITYDIEDCIDDSAHRLHSFRSDMCCYFVINSAYELLMWWPRRDIATKISDLKMRAQQIGERRHRYGVDNPRTGNNSSAQMGGSTGFNAAENQDPSFKLVAMEEPVGVGKGMEDLEKWVIDEAVSKTGVLALVGFGGVGKTTIATALFDKCRDQFDRGAIVAVSQTTDIEAILISILSQVMPQRNDNQERQDSSLKSSLTAAVRGVSKKAQESTRLDQLKKDLKEHLIENSYLVMIDDVWSTTTWSQVRKLFLPSVEQKKHGRIIVTTRFQAVATTCKRERGDLIHNVGPLSEDKTEMLFSQAFFESKGSRRAFPKKVWEMCRGLPLAIVTVAGYVACNPHKSENEWSNVCSSLGAKSGKELTQEELSRILSHCYNDMPAEIKTCCLYLSIFPKSHKISRKRLTRRWIAEGFVSEKHGLSVEDVAETYFNHLIRRKIIRPVEHSSNGKVKNCVVHDMVLEHILSKASEENFITVVGGQWLVHSPGSKVRRLSIQTSDTKRAKDTEKMNLSHVRSLTIFRSLSQLPFNSFKFGIMQVLDLEDCKGFKEHHIREICGMLHLKYLSLRGTDTKRLPKMIGKLENLETLDVRETNVIELPKTVCQLQRLVNIFGGDKRTHKALRLPDDMRKKMKALRTLSGIEMVDGSADLHHMADLRKLAIYRLNFMEGDASFKELSSSIEYLGGYSLHSLIVDDDSSKFLKLLGEMSYPPKFLTALELCGKMVKLPNWITQLDGLTKLTLSITVLRTDNLRYLSNLKALFSLSFTLAAGKLGPEIQAILAGNKMHTGGAIIVPADGFESLKLLRLSAPLLPLLSFSERAMPELERIELRFNMLEGIFGTEKLAGLKEVYLRLNQKDSEHMTRNIVGEMKSTVKRLEANRPRIIFDVE